MFSAKPPGGGKCLDKKKKKTQVPSLVSGLWLVLTCPPPILVHNYFVLCLSLPAPKPDFSTSVAARLVAPGYDVHFLHPVFGSSSIFSKQDIIGELFPTVSYHYIVCLHAPPSLVTRYVGMHTCDVQRSCCREVWLCSHGNCN